MYDYSVIVPVWNQPEVTERCAECLIADPANKEVIWVNNGSRRSPGLGTGFTVPDYLGHILLFDASGRHTVVTLSGNRGFGVAMNVGAQVATGEVLVFLNNDTEPEPGMLAGLVEALKEQSHCGLLVPRYTRAGLQTNVYSEADPSKGVEVLPPFGRYPSGVCYVIRSEMFALIDGFDTDLYPMNSGEDAELCYQLWEYGWNIAIDHRWCLKHVGAASSSQLPNKAELWRQNTKTFIQRWSHKWPDGKPPWTW